MGGVKSGDEVVEGQGAFGIGGDMKGLLELVSGSEMIRDGPLVCGIV